LAIEYSIYEYGWMISQRERMDPIRQALQGAVKPGAVVVDIGTGTGIFALLACQLGARRVYAIEPSDAILVAGENAAANGYADRIEFIQALSTEVVLPERADVIISELRGVLPFFEKHIPSIVDARLRFLAPGGVLIPWRDTLWAAVVNAPDCYQKLVYPWQGNDYGLDLNASHQILTNRWEKIHVNPDQLLVAPQSWAVLDYTMVENPDCRAELTWTVARSGTAHAMILWFDAELFPGVSFSNAPGFPKLGYSHGFFPWTAPVDLVPGDTVHVQLSTDLAGDYIWRWSTKVLASDGRLKSDFHQSTFFGTPFSPTILQRLAPGHTPALAENGQIDRFILELMDGQTSLEDIACRLLAEFAQKFGSKREALTRVGELSMKYGRLPANKYLKDV
jgi:type I protein arginine methyltransferase